jgi:hypothetical protein
MAFSNGNIATFSINGGDISAYTTSVDTDIKRDIKEIKPIGGAATSKLVGPYSGTISLAGGYDPALDAIISPLLLAATPALATWIHRPSGSGGGTRAISGSAYVASFKVTTPGDDTAKWTAELAVVGTIADA